MPKNLSFMHFRPDLFLLFLTTVIFLLICAYFQFQVTEINTSNLFKRIYWNPPSIDASFNKAVKNSWEEKLKASASFAIQGRRATMEDRFHIEENINSNTNVAIFALFDGHGGNYTAQSAKDVLVKNLCSKIAELNKLINTGVRKRDDENGVESGTENDESKICTKDNEDKESSAAVSLGTSKRLNDIDADRLNYQKGIALLKQQQQQQQKSDVKKSSSPSPPPKALDAKCYMTKGNKMDYARMVHDEILSFDYKLVETAKKNMIIAGSTAIIAIIADTRLIVANVGDSRGVMCDGKGNTIPLSFDHRPQSAREHRRIQEAGGFIAFKGVWRVSGILATSRSLGDYPLKPKLVIADPDILEFELTDHKPQFIILASDGLYDVFSNEESVAFIKAHIHEPHFGAKSLTLESYARGSVDNITVIVVVFRNGKFVFGSSL